MYIGQFLLHGIFQDLEYGGVNQLLGALPSFLPFALLFLALPLPIALP